MLESKRNGGEAQVGVSAMCATLATDWIGDLRCARLLTPGPVRAGSQVERVAGFLGRRVKYVNEVTELTGDRLVMRSVRLPFPMG